MPVRQPPPRRARPNQEVVGKATIDSAVIHQREQRGTRHREVGVSAPRFDPGVEPAFVKVAAGMTINIQNFESLRLDVSVTLPCLPEDAQSTYEEASEQVSNFLMEEQAKWSGVISKNEG